MKPRILMVDDEESLVWSLRNRFQHARPDWTFEGFTDPYEALGRIRELPPDVLITDIRMPKMSGVELLVAARASAPTLPAIVVTAYGSPDVLAAVTIRSNVEILEKPVRFEHLAERIDSLLLKAAGFSGAISLPLLPDLLQIYTLSMANGALSVRKGSDVGTVWFEKGEIVDAICNQQRGAEAVYDLLTWQAGSFSLDAGAQAEVRTIHVSWQGLLLEGCRRLDEKQRDSTPRPSPPAEAERLLAHIQAELAGFIGAALVNWTTGRTLGSVSARGDFEPASAAMLDCGPAFQGFHVHPALSPDSRLEDVLFTLDDQLHFLRRMRSDEVLYVATERHPTNLALVRNIVSRHLDELAVL